MNITIINDCQDANETGRQIARVSSLFNAPAHLIGVKNFSEIEAAGNLIDALDAIENRKGIVLVNVAPRHDLDNKHSNGTPFGYFYYKNVLVVSTIEGITLSLVKKLALAESIQVIETDKALDTLIATGTLDGGLKEHIVNTQFRSFDFVPRAAYYLSQGNYLPSNTMSIDEIKDAPRSVWWIDSFGNCKTTVLIEDIALSTNGKVKLAIGSLQYYSRLKDVPDGMSGIITGSSGINEKRFLEIVVQGGRASEGYKLNVGDEI
ncbi:hypothetical protein A3F34_02060 [Candidatus Roizmanbacteria bacterium RIFCSPHIGHO2_12_FULL_44_10]|uniref:S-adenosyl-l-methionine hydroxide adenosyltransferase C-terminal domain-containing protein n=1 Tax=Candidatus Roizmanbacteria bacterium RIFCSPHIGHO2_12_FULL_44_10 TaxID=1802054 RepID=A0A1F7I6C3_9BACT|nr:MAG: hypothetical protein A3F34_02060 [Candidatus Roizmanbacteria bacterium RIFCSPHIGHO2_12_FULL_44_10]